MGLAKHRGRVIRRLELGKEIPGICGLDICSHPFSMHSKKGCLVKGCRCKDIGKAKVPEEVNHPTHYGGDVPYEVIKVLEAWETMFGLKFNILTAIKYLPRAGNKDKAKEIIDLEKAIWYIQRRISQLKKAQ